MKWLLATVLILASVAGIAYYLSSDGDDKTIAGSVVLTNGNLIYRLGDYCEGMNGYRDLHRGSVVKVADDDGRIMAEGLLLTGRQGDGDCTLAFTIPGVQPSNSYTLQVGDREPIQISRASLEDQNWRVVLTVDDL